MADGVSASDNGTGLPRFSEVVGSFTFASPSVAKGGAEYKFDIRSAVYPSTEDRPTRVSIYDAYAGYRFADGAWLVRAGQMWLNDLGGLGSVGGAMAEYSLKKIAGQRVRFARSAGKPRSRRGLRATWARPRAVAPTATDRRSSSFDDRNSGATERLV
jgi:hypothetical protein